MTLTQIKKLPKYTDRLRAVGDALYNTMPAVSRRLYNEADDIDRANAAGLGIKKLSKRMDVSYVV